MLPTAPLKMSAPFRQKKLITLFTTLLILSFSLAKAHLVGDKAHLITLYETRQSQNSHNHSKGQNSIGNADVMLQVELLHPVIVCGVNIKVSLKICAPFHHSKLIAFFTTLLILSFSLAKAHLVGDKAHLTELKKLCEHAYTCFHDTVMICGKSVNEARTFLDLCDLYEYSCEYTMVFRHVKEEEGVCPNAKELTQGK